MIFNRIVVIGLFALTAAQAHPLDDLVPGEWYELPDSAVQSVAYEYPAGTHFGNTGKMRFLVESGGSYDSKRDRLIVWGGGHGDYAGNEIYVFDIPTMRWIRVNDPSPRFDKDGTTESSGYYPDENGDPDPQQPRSRHSYYYQVYVPTIDRYCSFGMVFSFPSSKSSKNVDCFDFEAKRWERKSDTITTGALAHATFDPRTGHVWIHGTFWSNTEGFLAEWDPVTDTYTKRSDAPSGVKKGSSPALDTRRHNLVMLGAGELRVFDLSWPGTLSARPVELRGDTEILEMQRGGFAYDPENDRFVAWSGDIGGRPQDIYVINPETWESQRLTLGGNTVPSPPATFSNGASNGVYGRFAYLPSHKAFILVNNRLADTVFFFKLPDSGAPPPPDWISPDPPTSVQAGTN